MGNRLNVSHGAPQNQASFIVDQGWKSSNSSPLPVEGEVFFLTFPFIDQAFTLRTGVRWRIIQVAARATRVEYSPLPLPAIGFWLFGAPPASTSVVERSYSLMKLSLTGDSAQNPPGALPWCQCLHSPGVLP